MYKYSCRKCPIRNRCIEESEYTVSVKNMIEHAFGNRTDTLATWGLLQANCLLIKAEEEQEKRAREGSSTLTRRLRQARAAREKANQASARTTGKKKSVIRRLPQTRKAREEAAKARGEKQVNQEETAEVSSTSSSASPDYLQPVSRSNSTKGYRSSTDERPHTIGTSDAALDAPPSSSTRRQSSKTPRKPCWFTVSGSNRHIALPVTGELILGRFDASFGVPPDVDLAYEDAGNGTISRRHAKIVGRQGYHTIEDTGSRHGVFINGDKIRPGSSHPLKAGDRVTVGAIKMMYDEVPGYLRSDSQDPNIQHILLVTPTGRKLTIAPPDDIVVGRVDRYVDLVPDVDLSQDGDAAARVSRRHANIYWRDGKPHIEDLGSGFGTRVNGKIILIGQSTPLKPGDHIWLGGCVLAYDIRI